jgi:hypothetical protein
VVFYRLGDTFRESGEVFAQDGVDDVFDKGDAPAVGAFEVHHGNAVPGFGMFAEQQVQAIRVVAVL